MFRESLRCAGVLFGVLGAAGCDDDPAPTDATNTTNTTDAGRDVAVVDVTAPRDAPFVMPSGRLVESADPSLAAMIPASSGRSGEYYGGIARDLDGDGVPELLGFTDQGWVLLTRGANTTWRVVTQGSEPVRTAAFCDLDNDGAPEVLMARHRPMVLHNDGALRFTDVTTAALGGADVQGTYFGITCADLDWDGLLDVAVAQMACGNGPNRVYRNEGAMRFQEVGDVLSLSTPSGASFSLVVDRMVDDDTLHVWNLPEGCVDFGTRHWRFRAGDDLPRVLEHTITNAYGATPMGSAILDVDLDGTLDLYLASDGHNIVFGGPGYVTSMVDPRGLEEHPPRIVNPTSAWATVLFDANLDGAPDLYVTHSPARPDQSPERVTDGVYLRGADHRFTEMGERLGIVADHDCQTAFGVDLDRDGDTDLLTGCSSGLRVLRNDLMPAGAGRTVVLRGTVSNPEGVHAILVGPDGEQRAQRGGGQPCATGVQHESLRADHGAVRVLWPSGITQSVPVGDAPVLTITEPAAVRVSPRRVAAGASTPVRVEVDPGALGTPDADVAVTATAGAWSTPVARDADGRWRGVLTPPAAASTVALTVRIGALTLRVRPKVFVR